MTTAHAKNIHQLVHTLSYGDAISGEVISLQRVLREAGVNSEIFAINVHPKYKGLAHKYETFPRDFDGTLILHYSLGSPLNDLYKCSAKARRALIYHNLTPSSWFAGVNPRVAADIEHGIKELPSLCKMSDLLLADSKFNASELEKMGFKSHVLELPLDPARWTGGANPGIANLVQREPGIHLLHVGRMAPNKSIEDIIKIFYFVHRFVNPQSRLWLVGIDIDTELYSFALKRLVHELDLQNAVNFSGGLADSEVRALYENATAYLCMSEHEGFCLPVIEAMHFGLPVIAYDSSALSDTVGAGGILIKDKRHAEIAELVGMVATDQNFRKQMIDAGKKRVAELSVDRFSSHARELFAE